MKKTSGNTHLSDIFHGIVSYYIEETKKGTTLSFSSYSPFTFKLGCTVKTILVNGKINEDILESVRKTFQNTVWVTYNKQNKPEPDLVDILGCRPSNWVNAYFCVSRETYKNVEYGITDQTNENEIRLLCDHFKISQNRFEISSAIMEVYFNYMITRNFPKLLKTLHGGDLDTPLGDIVVFVRFIPNSKLWFFQEYHISTNSFKKAYIKSLVAFEKNRHYISLDENTSSRLKVTEEKSKFVIDLHKAGGYEIHWHGTGLVDFIVEEDFQKIFDIEWSEPLKELDFEKEKSEILIKSVLVHDYIRMSGMGYSRFDIIGMGDQLKEYKNWQKNPLGLISNMKKGDGFCVTVNQKDFILIFGSYVSHKLNDKDSLEIKFKYNRDLFAVGVDYKKEYSKVLSLKNNNVYLFKDSNYYPSESSFKEFEFSIEK